MIDFSDITLLYVFDLIGTFVFAMSGVLISSNNKFDFFGAVVVAFATAIGGGTLRDVLLGIHPICWIANHTYIYDILAAVIVCGIFKKYVSKWSRTMFLFDTIGLSAFTIIGVQKTLTYGGSAEIAVIMGTITAVFGGVIRDILCNEQPLIFRKEIYATPCIIGGVVLVLLEYWGCEENLAMCVTAVLIFVIRLLAVKRKWSLPTI